MPIFNIFAFRISTPNRILKPTGTHEHLSNRLVGSSSWQSEAVEWRVEEPLVAVGRFYASFRPCYILICPHLSNNLLCKKSFVSEQIFNVTEQQPQSV